MITKVLLVLWILIIMFYIVTCDEKGKKLQKVLSLIFFVDIKQTCCHHLRVHFADHGDCNGEYALSNISVSWAPDKPVYKHLYKNR